MSSSYFNGSTPTAQHLIVATDLGTTYTSTAVVKSTDTRTIALAISTIKDINGYPEDPYKRGDKDQSLEVPTVIWFPSGHGAPKEGHNRLLTGYEVREMLRDPDSPAHAFKNECLISGMKFLLFDDAENVPIRQAAKSVVQKLIRRDMIQTEDDVLVIFLATQFRHVKSQLESRFDFNDHDSVEMIVTVPISGFMLRWRMQSIVERALKLANFQVTSATFPINLKLVHEPQAIGHFALAFNLLNKGEKVLIVDVGGGTVCTSVYQITNTAPLRLRMEQIEPKGAFCGGSLVNDEFERELDKILPVEEMFLRAFSRTHVTRDGIKSAILNEFESVQKKRLGLDLKDWHHYRPELHDVDPANWAPGQKLIISAQILASCFEPTLAGTARLVRSQLEIAGEVDKALVRGGYGNSPLMRRRIGETIESWNTETGTSTELLGEFNHGYVGGTDVSRGGVLWASDPEGGPSKIAQYTVAILIREEFDKDFPDHQGKGKVDKLTQQEYVRSWDHIILKGQHIEPVFKWKRDVYHDFRFTSVHFTCEEQIIYSDSNELQRYPSTDEVDAGHFYQFYVKWDMKSRKNRLPIFRTDTRKPQKYYQVRCRLHAEAHGLLLRFWAVWQPENGERETIPATVTHFNMAACFEPGTKPHGPSKDTTPQRSKSSDTMLLDETHRDELNSLYNMTDDE